jgi:8-amino-7-oxononanoate synthase
VIEPEPLQQVDRTYVIRAGRKLSYFSGCDYFRLSSHPKVRQAVNAGMAKYGLSVAASRLTTGNHVLYLELERSLAKFFKAPAALLVSSGYIANFAVAQALAGQFSHALIDQAAHPSLNDAARILDCPILQFAHRSAADLSVKVNRCGPGSRLLVLTDGMFARDGSVAPLREFLKDLPDDAVLLVDDAHGAGTLGRHGRGTPEHVGAGRARVIQTITLSKAFGAYGGAILCSKQLRTKIVERSQVFVGSTPLPLPLASAALQASKILEVDPSFRSRLARNSMHVKGTLVKAGVVLPETPGPILALTSVNSSGAAKVTRALLRAGIHPPFIRYPGGPASGYFRFVISSEHTRAQLDNLSRTLMGIAPLLQSLPEEVTAVQKPSSSPS